MRALAPGRALLLGLLALMVAACTSVPPLPPQPTALPNGVTPEQMVAAIRTAAIRSPSELDVQPLRDPEAEDLRQEASTLEARRMYRPAADLLQRALAVTPDDPAVLQEAAEVAILLWEFDQAEQLARRASALGGKVGPLCRRHWTTVEQVANARLADSTLRTSTGSRATAEAQARSAGEMAGKAKLDASDARRQRDACTVAAPDRF